MSITIEQLAQNAINAIEQRITNLNTLNIIVAGKTGVGKSTLINAVFRENLVQTGTGKPVTEHMCKVTKKGVPLSIYDTRGFELGKEVQTQVKHEIIDTIRKGLSTDINQAIHCIWYCINTASNRVEPEEIKWIKDISRENQTIQVPIIIILTQTFSKKKGDALRKILENENLNVAKIVPVLAQDIEIDDDQIIKSFGLDTLIKTMANVLPDELLDTLHNVQIASIAEKQSRARKSVIAAATLAATAAATPLPFSDWMALAPIQVGMIADITVVFGLNINKSIITAFLSSVLGSGGATIAGRIVFANLIKFIPGVGSIAGGAISAATAATITGSLGEAYIKIMTLVLKGELNVKDLSSAKGTELTKKLFKEELAKTKH